ncbi:MAG: type I restriction enzyme HsdR N-terminal domain-containing protein [Holophagaceae bacterium]|nr:type I restriction enzyme HsdR N-terminal domain-containing protein [Holophagaceae bacterium]
MLTGLEEELFEAAILALKDSIITAPKKLRRMRLRSLLNKFSFKIRTADRLQRLTKAFGAVGILTQPPLLDCGRDAWVFLSILQPVAQHEPGPDPMDPWFEEISKKEFATEKEVEIRFIVPLLERLGYTEDDRADGFPIEIIVGSKRTVAEADFVLFGGRNRSMNNALLVIEAKRTTKRVKDHVSQARSYAMFMGTPYYMVTNGDDILVFCYQSPLEADHQVFSGQRITLRDSFQELFEIIGKPHAAAKNIERRTRRN